MPEVTAKLRYLQMAPRKVRMAADLIRGMDVQKAKLQLEKIKRRAAGPLKKLLSSSVANATHSFHLQKDSLYIWQVRVDGGPMLKRAFPRARGRADVKRKRTSHITLVLKSKSDIKPAKSDGSRS